jgi:hypothetical protein
MSDVPRYVVALRVPHARVEGLHVTLCVMPQANWDEGVLEETRQLAHAILPLRIGYGDQAMFGKDGDVPVRLVHFHEPPKLALCDAYYLKHFVPRDGEQGRTVQTFHVTTTKLTGAEINTLADMQLVSLFVKVVGEKTTIWDSGDII